MLDVLREHWSMIYTVVTGAVAIGLLLLSKTYAKRDEVELMNRRLSELEVALATLPNRAELYNLQLEIANLRGDIKAVAPELQQLRRMSDLLLQNELKEKK
ncbi:DUF2730 family protein [Morganella morganii]|uniref:DUF2730 family protein n=1 Tax=Morganella TaxID=581 RepID=UPI001050283A|nr:DUF2730 family protein [Morganella morganii]EGT3609594.1 DUF2730 family protein [Morganella morganii]EKW8487386.1 DUF2730 family protein [Morganella morganii]ELA7678760.1 DUF2730 family protein [Morganella morganii]ELA9131487.1 DUF2730 family protein [Morganella morganii]ELO7537302.1 DUF2730 family protein [Morganella morganii]